MATDKIRVLLTAAADSSGTYRINMPAREVMRQNPGRFDVKIAGESDDVDLEFGKQGFPIKVDPKTHAYGGLGDFEADLVVLQRPMGWFMPHVIDDLHDRGIPVIVELDDDFHTAHPGNRAFRDNHPKVSPVYNWHHLGKCVRAADHVTVSTAQLAKRYGSHGRVSILRNAIDDAWLDIPHVYGGRRIGWPGTVVNHPTDAQQTQGALDEVLAGNPDWRFACIGGGEHRDEILDAFRLHDHADQVETTDWQPLRFHPYLVTTLEICIAPLWLSTFNEAKSWLKPLEAASLGIPSVCSETQEYRKLYNDFGIGMPIRNRSKDWRRALSWLIDLGDDARADLGRALRETVKAELTISKRAHEWATAWADVVEKGVRNLPRTNTSRSGQVLMSDHKARMRATR